MRGRYRLSPSSYPMALLNVGLCGECASIWRWARLVRHFCVGAAVDLACLDPRTYQASLSRFVKMPESEMTHKPYIEIHTHMFIEAES